jgi:hypothetical protein
MARTLETRTSGTPVYCGDTHVGEVRALYAEGTSRAVDWVVVRWSNGGREVAVPASEVESVNDGGVRLMHSDQRSYAELTTFDEARFPTAHRLA